MVLNYPVSVSIILIKLRLTLFGIIEPHSLCYLIYLAYLPVRYKYISTPVFIMNLYFSVLPPQVKSAQRGTNNLNGNRGS